MVLYLLVQEIACFQITDVIIIIYQRYSNSSIKYNVFALLGKVKCWNFKYYLKTKEKNFKKSLKRKNTAKIFSQESRMPSNIMKNEQKRNSMYLFLSTIIAYLKTEYSKQCRIQHLFYWCFKIWLTSNMHFKFFS